MVAVKRVVLDVMMVEGGAIDFDALQPSIYAMGGSLHSIDEVEVLNETHTG